MLGLQNEREWKLLLRARCCGSRSSRPTRASTRTRCAPPRAANCARSSWRRSAALSAAQVIERLDEAQIANAQMNTMHDVWAHPQLKARERWPEVGDAGRPGAGAAAAGRARRTSSRAWTRCPRWAQHTDAILRELGYDGDAHRALRAAVRDLNVVPVQARNDAHRRQSGTNTTRPSCMNDHPSQHARHLRRQLRFDRHPARRWSSAPKTCARLARLGAGRQGRAAGRRPSRASRGRWGRQDGAVRSADRAQPHHAALRGDGQRRGLALRRTGRRAQRLGVPSGGGGVPGGAGAGAGDSAQSGASCSTAAVAGYEVGIRVGEFLGRSHYKVFHTTGTAGTRRRRRGRRAPARLSPAQMLHAFGSAGTQAAGLWEFLRDAADSKQLHTAMAAADGLMAAYLAQDGFTGARAFSKARRAWRPACRRDADPARLTDRLGSRWALAETSFKYPRLVPPHASGRRRVAAGGAANTVCAPQRHRARRRACAPGRDRRARRGRRAAAPCIRRSSHGHGARPGRALRLCGRDRVRAALLRRSAIAAFRDKVEMALDDEVDRRLSGALDRQGDGARPPTAACCEGRVDEPKGDPGNTLSRDEIAKASAAPGGVFRRGQPGRDARRALLDRAWQIARSGSATCSAGQDCSMHAALVSVRAGQPARTLRQGAAPPARTR